MEKQIKKMYYQDCTVIIISTAILWIVLSFTMVNVNNLAPDYVSKMIIIIVGIMTGAFSTAALIAVLTHLKKKNIELYKEDITASMNGSNHCN